jgi:hypothetical protein
MTAIAALAKEPHRIGSGVEEYASAMKTERK